jgi:uncharacterized membrane protein
MTKSLRSAFQGETMMALFGLCFASAVAVFLVFSRIAWTGNLRYAYLVWNLFLAWLPLLFALLARDTYREEGGRNWRFCCLATAWLLFFPNAPYIFTDLIHLSTQYYAHFWVDLMLILPCALTGLVLGFLSLYLMHDIMARLAGQLAGWFFIATITALSGFGVYLGRFHRFNSWDVLTRPVQLYQGLGAWISAPWGLTNSYAFPFLFAAFLFTSYVMLYGLTHLRPLTSNPIGVNATTVAT